MLPCSRYVRYSPVYTSCVIVYATRSYEYTSPVRVSYVVDYNNNNNKDFQLLPSPYELVLKIYLSLYVNTPC